MKVGFFLQFLFKTLARPLTSFSFHGHFNLTQRPRWLILRIHPVPLVGGFTSIEEPFTHSLWGQCQDAPIGDSSGATSYTNQLNQVTRYVYDPLERKTAETNANLEVTRFVYNGAGDLLTLTDGKNQTTAWKYDSFGRVTNKLDHLGTNLFLYGYDFNHRLTSRESAAKGLALYRYDAVGNLTNLDYAVSPDIHLRYDAVSRLTNMVDAVGATVYSYTAAGQLQSEDGPWASDTVSYAYDHRRRQAVNVQAFSASDWRKATSGM